jgi:hypothetical protein
MEKVSTTPGINIFTAGIQMNNNNDFFHNNSLFLIGNGLKEMSKEQFNTRIKMDMYEEFSDEFDSDASRLACDVERSRRRRPDLI